MFAGKGQVEKSSNITANVNNTANTTRFIGPPFPIDCNTTRAKLILPLPDIVAEASLTVKRELRHEHHHKLTYDTVFQRRVPTQTKEITHEGAPGRDKIGVLDLGLGAEEAQQPCRVSPKGATPAHQDIPTQS
jgi:hypothetical protein